MPSWELMQLSDRVRMAIACFPTLELDVAQKTIEEWAANSYPDNWEGEQKAIDDLMMMLRNASMDEVQLAQERRRITSMVERKLNKDRQ